MTILLHQVDAFTDRPYSGTPAAVCLMNEAGPSAWMQRVAAVLMVNPTHPVAEVEEARQP